MNPRPPRAFLAYSHADNRHDQDFALALKTQLMDEVHALTGTDEFEIFVDRHAIKWGQDWRCELDSGLLDSLFLIPLVTPRFFKSPECRQEVLRFHELEISRRRNDLILPIYYIAADPIEHRSKPGIPAEELEVAKIISDHQWVDWRSLRNEDMTSSPVRKKVTELVGMLRAAIERVVAPLAPVAASAAGQSLIFDANSPGYHQDLQSLVRICAPGGTIVVRPGVHIIGPTEVMTPLDIRSADGGLDRTILQLPAGSSINWKADGGTIDGITIRGGGGAPALRMFSNRLLVQDCLIEGGDSPCVQVQFNGGGTIRRSRLCRGQYGLAASHPANVEVEDSTISDNSAAGISASVQSELRVRRNLITKNGHGLWLYSGAGGLYEDNDLRGNRVAAVSLDKHHGAVLRNNQGLDAGAA